VGGLLWLIGPSRWPHFLGEDFLARDASVLVVVVSVLNHEKSITHNKEKHKDKIKKLLTKKMQL